MSSNTTASSSRGIKSGSKEDLRQRKKASTSSSLSGSSTPEIREAELDKRESHKRSKFNAKLESKSSLAQLESWLAPLVFTVLAFAVRLYRISANNHVVWDEAHFGKFGSYYLRHEFYHDVHPPLGKMLIGLSGYLAGYNGSWDFPSGEQYPEYIDYTKMRVFQVVFSALCTPLAYFTCKEIGYSVKTTWLFTLMVTLELSYIVLGKFILLDSMLLFFTVATVFAFTRFNNFNTSELEFLRKWWKWLLLTGFSIGCTCSVKMVGLFVTTLVGIYTVVDLWNKLGQKSMSWKTYGQHWLARGIALILIPMIIFMISFKVHFDLLYKSGTGDATMSSLFQANLLGSDVGGDARDIIIGHSVITLKNQGLAGGLLHSHVQTYPEGSKQQQVTVYSHKDSNNNWILQRPRNLPPYDVRKENQTEYVIDGNIVRLMHTSTGRNLHSHDIAAPIGKSYKEVSCYGNVTIGDDKDHWRVEVVEQFGDEDRKKLHPLSTSFRLKNVVMDCYLATSGNNLPAWGFRQGEVTCIKNPFKRDKRTWWNIENHQNDILPRADNISLPRTSFFKDFIQLNLAMMATNNALVPDTEKQDDLSSSAWQWPTLNTGIRMCGWGVENVKYYMIGSPGTTLPSTFGVLAFFIVVLYFLLRWQRQFVDFPTTQPLRLKQFLMGGIYPMFGWGLHFMPFIIMGRVTYVHHYVPALYFAMLVWVYELELWSNAITRCRGPVLGNVLHFLSYVGVIYAFIHWRHLVFGMDGPKEKFLYLDLFPTWRVGNDNYE